MNGAVLVERGASSRLGQCTSQDEAPVKDARSPQNADAFWLPHAPLRGACGVPDRRFSGCPWEMFSMKRTLLKEVIMSHFSSHSHAEFDRFPLLIAEFGADAVEAIIDAELADFVWDSRFAERHLGAWEGFDEDDESGEMVRIIGYFHRRYVVATCIVDGNRHVLMMVTQRHFDTVEDAERAFLDGGG
jgi:hypothetical protein